MKFITNNSRFLILPGINIPNLALRVLALNLKRLSSDWLQVYEHPVIMAETFIDHSRFKGTSYKAAGFIALGQTQGFRRHNGYYYKHGISKTIMVRLLHTKAFQWLSTRFWGLTLMDHCSRELIRTGVVPSISPETVLRILHSQKLKPWRHHMWLSSKTKRDEAYGKCYDRKRQVEFIDFLEIDFSPYPIIHQASPQMELSPICHCDQPFQAQIFALIFE